jgi:hypothetical protein
MTFGDWDIIKESLNFFALPPPRKMGNFVQRYIVIRKNN